jgi:mRNA-degrading endonuclease RelE of RelBE toxin-antitoxin system
MAAYEIVFAASVEMHLKALSAKDRRIVLDGIEELLGHQPVLETRNRKPMRPNALATWKLRLGDLRVYYHCTEARRRVEIVAIGVKKRQEIWIGGERIKL